MSYVYNDHDGYKFLCHIFSIISRDRTMKEIFNENIKDLSNTANDEIMMEYLIGKWDRFSSSVFSKNPDIKENILEHFERFHPGKGEGWQLLSIYQDNWKKHTVKGIVKQRKETRDPQVAFGIAATLAVAMLNQNDRDFYIGQDEAKKILFSCLDCFGYQDVEFIPDRCFEETEYFRKLFFSALYSTLLFLYPAKGGDTRKLNFDNGKLNILNIIKSDTVSDLYTAFEHVAEARNIAEKLWDTDDITEQYLSVSGTRKLPMSKFYIVPDIVSDRRIGVLTCERGQAIRSLIEGRSGCGKSTLAKVISLICQNKNSGSGKYIEVEEVLDFRREMLPVVIDCKELRSADLEYGILDIGLKQMLSRSDSRNANINSQHFKECEKYLLAFLEHKILQEEVLLIVDGYSKIPADCIEDFNRLFKDLCKRSTLHVVVITDNLKPSAKFRLNEAFNDSYNEFLIKETYADTAYISSVLNYWGLTGFSAIKADFFVQLYVNTPRRLLRYARALADNENIHTVISSCLEEELDICKKYIRYREEYPEFIRSLTLLALKERREKERCISKLTISEKQARKVKGKYESWAEIWSNIENESIMLEYCDNVNSLEFCTPLYFYTVMADYYLEMLQKNSSEAFTEEFAYLSCKEFANILGILFYRLYEDKFENISDSNAEFFIRAVVAKLFEVETMDDLEYCQWAVTCMMSEEYKTAFIHGGTPGRRGKIWRVLQRAYISLDMCKETFCEYGLLVQ